MVGWESLVAGMKLVEECRGYIEWLGKPEMCVIHTHIGKPHKTHAKIPPRIHQGRAIEKNR